MIRHLDLNDINREFVVALVGSIMGTEEAASIHHKVARLLGMKTPSLVVVRKTKQVLRELIRDGVIYEDVHVTRVDGDPGHPVVRRFYRLTRDWAQRSNA